MTWTKNTRYGRNSPKTLTQELASERLLERAVVHKGKCWGWNGQMTRGRPVLRVAGVRYKAHRLSAYVWIGFDLDSDLQVNHHCDNTMCISPRHLYIGTQGDNIRDSYVRQRRTKWCKGESIGTSKLSEDQVLAIIELRRQGLTYDAIGLIVGIGTVEAWRICNGKRWAWLTSGERSSPS